MSPSHRTNNASHEENIRWRTNDIYIEDDWSEQPQAGASYAHFHPYYTQRLRSTDTDNPRGDGACPRTRRASRPRTFSKPRKDRSRDHWGSYRIHGDSPSSPSSSSSSTSSSDEDERRYRNKGQDGKQNRNRRNHHREHKQGHRTTRHRSNYHDMSDDDEPLMAIRKMTEIMEAVRIPHRHQRESRIKRLDIHNIPKFAGGYNSDPQHHLQAFHDACALQNIESEWQKLKLFPRTLVDEAEIWYRSLEPDSIHRWSTMLELFNEKYQTYARVSNLRKQIQGWKQENHEPLDVALDRYYSLLHRCPGHDFSQKEQLFHIIDGLRNQTRETLGIYAQGRLSELKVHQIQRRHRAGGKRRRRAM